VSGPPGAIVEQSYASSHADTLEHNRLQDATAEVKNPIRARSSRHVQRASLSEKNCLGAVRGSGLPRAPANRARPPMDVHRIPLLIHGRGAAAQGDASEHGGGGQRARQHGAHLDPSSGSRPTRAENSTSQARSRLGNRLALHDHMRSECNASETQPGSYNWQGAARGGGVEPVVGR
jgi:hypothetical protein